MPRRWFTLLALPLLILSLEAAPLAAQEPRDFSGTFVTDVTGFTYEDPVFYVTYAGNGDSDLLGGFSIDYGLFTFDPSDPKDYRIYDGYMTLTTAKGDLWTYFEGGGVFTGRFNGTLYFYGGTGIYENAFGLAELAAQFWQRDFTYGDASFTFVGTIWY